MLTKEAKRAMRGMALGDGFAGFSKGSYFLGLIHSVKQKEYLEYKVAILEEALQKKVKISERISCGKYPGLTARIYDPYFKWIRKRLYKDSTKCLTMRYLRSLDNRAVAIWYMDDGNLYHKKRNGKVHASDLQISLYASEEEANIAIQFFEERYGVKFRLKRNKGKFSIVCYTHNAKKLLEQIRPYIIESMLYKTFPTRNA